MFTLALILTLTQAPRAAAHAGHGNEPFARKFAEFANSQFKIRPVRGDAPASYVVFPDGRRVALDSRYQAAVEAMAASLAERPESEDLYENVGWREWTRYRALGALDKVKSVFSRGFVLHLSGLAVQSSYRFGTLVASIIVGAEFTEHFVLAPTLAALTPKLAAINPLLGVVAPVVASVPLCEAIAASCVFLAREAQELTNTLNPAVMPALTLREKVARWSEMRKQRKLVRRAMKNVFAPDGSNRSARARRRSYRDLSAGNELIYGGAFSPGFFRGTLADLDCEDCAGGHVKQMRYVVFPTIEDLSALDFGPRLLRIEEYVAFVDLTFKFAAAAANDLLRARRDEIVRGVSAADPDQTRLAVDALTFGTPSGVREFKLAPEDQTLTRAARAITRAGLGVRAAVIKDEATPEAGYQLQITSRVPLTETRRKLPGYHALHREIGLMRKVADAYRYGLEMRARDGGAPSAEARVVDQEFAKAMATFIKSYNQRLSAIDDESAGPLTDDHPLRAVPAEALAKARAWLRSDKFCETALAN